LQLFKFGSLITKFSILIFAPKASFTFGIRGYTFFVFYAMILGLRAMAAIFFAYYYLNGAFIALIGFYDRVVKM